jgi:cbb3-type cytochrome oxidase maturation protein
MYFIAWIILIAVSLWVSLLGFLWALKTGQFSEQGRARYLPLVGESDHLLSLPENPSRLGIEVYVLLSIFGIGVLALITTFAVLIFHGRG